MAGENKRSAKMAKRPSNYGENFKLLTTKITEVFSELL